MHVFAQQEQAPEVGDSRRGLDSLLTGCGVYPAQRTLVSLAGRDRVRWLNGMVTNNVRDLTPGFGVYAFVLSPQGHILGDLYVFNRAETLVASIDPAQAEALLQIFRRYIIMDKVEITELSGTAVLGITGPNCAAVLSALGLSADLRALQIADTQWTGTDVTLVRSDNPCVPGYEFWLPAEKSEAVHSALVQAGATPVNGAALEDFRILCGIPKFGADIRDRTLPQETAQERALNFTKGCYIGQEIVERIRSRGAVHRALAGFELEGPVPTPGTKIQAEGKDVGEITSVIAAPFSGKLLALGYIRKEFAAKALSAGNASVKPMPLPFTTLFSH